MDETNEEWREVVGYEGWYEVSSFGRVRRARCGPHTAIGREVQLTRGKQGYLRAGLWRDSKQKLALVHRLVALAFIPNPLNKRTVNHKNGVKNDNRVENLEWMTHGENVQHAYDTGLTVAASGDKHKSRTKPESILKGASHGMSKIDAATVVEIRALSGTMSQRLIGLRFGISQGQVSRIVLGQRWKA